MGQFVVQPVPIEASRIGRCPANPGLQIRVECEESDVIAKGTFQSISPYARCRAAVGILLLACASLVGCDSAGPGPASEPADIDVPLGKGKVDSATFQAPQDSYDYLTYTPAGWKQSDRLPLYVMLHGCGTTPDQQMNSNLLNPLADRERFIVLYADNGTLSHLLPGLGQCWRGGLGFDSSSISRGGGGDADAVAGMTKAVMEKYNVDPQRVYLMGMSAGAFQSTATGAAYSDLFAAIGINAGGGYAMGFPCLAMTDEVVPTYAQMAVSAMGTRAHVMPFFSIGGTEDPLGETAAPGGCSRLAFKQWMATNNILATGKPDGTAFTQDDAATQMGTVPNGYPWTRYIWRDQKRCQIGERWIVEGMGHFWSGGTSDPAWAAFTDPKGPSATVASWRFFKQFTLSGGNIACSTSP